MRMVTRLVGLISLVAATVSCGDVVRQGSSPVYMVIDILQGVRGAVQPGTPSGTLTSDVITNVTSPAPCTTDAPCPTIFSDSGSVQLHAPLKDIGATASLSPTSNNAVTINRYHVEYTRADGRDGPANYGVYVPYPFDGAITGTIPPGGNLTAGFELVRAVAKQEAPLVQLRSSSNIISSIAVVTFYGVDSVGNQLQVTGKITIEFGNFGDF
jgi:hypothetical protein